MFSFLREGLRSGAKCLCAFDATDHDTRYAEVNAQLDVASAGDQLDIVLPADLYLKRSGFSIPDMIDYWNSWAEAALGGGGFPATRGVGEMTWAVTEVIGTADFFRYESEHAPFPASPVPAIHYPEGIHRMTTTKALLATLEAKPGREQDVAEFLKAGLPIVQGEPATTAWFAHPVRADHLRHLRRLSRRCRPASPRQWPDPHVAPGERRPLRPGAHLHNA